MLNKIKHNFAKRWKIIALLILVLIGVGYWYYRTSTKEEEVLTFVKPERGPLDKTLEIAGSVNAKEYAKMRFAGGGKLVYLGAKEGDLVKKWQTIATIDARSLKKTLEKSLNEYSQERIDWDQTLDDTQDRWIPKEEDRVKQKEQIDLNQTVLDVEIQDIAITNTVLSAPFEGVLVSLPTNVIGVNLAATDTFELVNPNTLYFQAQVDELDISQVKIGQTATIELDAFQDEKFESTVQFISYKSAQTSTSTIFLIEIPLNQFDLNRYRIGMNGDATIILEHKEGVLSIPLDATIERDGETYVNVRTGEDTYEERQIDVGLETEDDIEVTSGLTEQDEVLLPE